AASEARLSRCRSSDSVHRKALVAEKSGRKVAAFTVGPDSHGDASHVDAHLIADARLEQPHCHRTRGALGLVAAIEDDDVATARGACAPPPPRPRLCFHAPPTARVREDKASAPLVVSGLSRPRRGSNGGGRGGRPRLRERPPKGAGRIEATGG